MFLKNTLTVLLLGAAFVLTSQLIIPSIGFCDNSSSVVDDQTDDQDDFFEEESSDSEIDLTFETENQKDKSFSIKGNLEFKANYNFAHDRPEPGQTDHRGLSALTAALDLDISMDLSETFDFVMTSSAFYNYAYNLNSDTEYTPHFLDNYEREVELNKAFIRGELTDNLDIKLGRQIVVWGKSDNIRITDVLNPINALEIGMTDINDLRLPVLMSRMDYYKNDLTVSSYLIHEHRGNRLPVYGSDFYYSGALEPETETPSMDVKNTGFAMSVSKVLTGMDIALYLARKYDNNPYLDIRTRNGVTQLYFDYAKINMLGLAWNKAKGNFLLKAETAYINGIHLSAYQNNGVWTENSNS
ncbi:MAG: hypothetical protein GY707_10320, partial [Desulfobacteraceae bacterium]|nr:hypothetical protein [Desulfobacteraceae bacterium]